MKKVFLAVVAFAIVVPTTLFLFNIDSADDEEVSTPVAGLNEATTTFSWRFTEAETNNLDGVPQTNIFLTITHSGRTIERQVDTVDGGCSELEGEKYEGDVSDTGSVQCYAAGFGQQYRITQSKYIFFVERKFFEEALPDITPTEYEWEVVGEFSFT